MKIKLKNSFSCLGVFLGLSASFKSWVTRVTKMYFSKSVSGKLYKFKNNLAVELSPQTGG